MEPNILESLREQGVLKGDLQEKLSNLLPENIQEKLSGFYERYQTMDDEQKKEFMEEALGVVTKSLRDKVSYTSRLYMWLYSSQNYTVFFLAVLFIILILVFFVYKLFKCLSEREMKREEKKRNKQLKKKK